jgi:mono/diheme cytochrome c family protein
MVSVLKIVGGLIFLLMLFSRAMGQEIIKGDPQIGRGLYEVHCFLCHGLKGDGKGPQAQYLTVPPTNFHSVESRSKSDWELMIIITYGSAFSPMHGWADRFNQQERGDVLSYIRVLAPFKPVT